MTRWVRFAGENGPRFGTLEDDTVHEHSGDMFGEPTPTGVSVPLASCDLLTPVEPTKMVALANNYHALLEKSGGHVPEEPLYFFKANSSFHPTGKPIRRPSGYDGRIVFEGELGLVIGRTCQNVSAAEALDYLFGCTCINDVTSMDILNRDPSFQQWTRCKAADTFGVMGPTVATGLDPSSLVVKAYLDDSERQNYPVTDMVFTPAELIAKISQDMRLLPGDVIACGTNVGVGALRPGNTIVIEIDGVGRLVNEFEP